MISLILGAVLMLAASVLDFIFRSRMHRGGFQHALFTGGAFNYREYHQERVKQGWPAWPVYLMWSMMIAGLALLIAGVFITNGLQSLRSR